MALYGNEHREKSEEKSSRPTLVNWAPNDYVARRQGYSRDFTVPSLLFPLRRQNIPEENTVQRKQKEKDITETY